MPVRGHHGCVSSHDSAPRTLWLLRHAESEGNVADSRAQDAGAERLDLVARDADMPLSETGRRQAAALGRAWQALPPDERPTVVLSSPYERAMRTAELAVGAAGWDLQVLRDERLRERDLGVLDGFTKHGIEQQFPDEAARRKWLGKFYYRPPGGESWADVAGRVRAVVDTIERRYAGERIVIASHQAVLMLFRYVLEGITEQQVLDIDAEHRIANVGLLRYRYDGTVPRLEAFNDTRHLDDLREPVTREPDVASAEQ